MANVFITGGTGYMGQRLIPELSRRGHNVRALARPGSETNLPSGCQPVVGNALDVSSYAGHLAEGDTFVHLVGVAHPSPAKAREFRSIDLVAAQGAITLATQKRMRHFIYVSVAQPCTYDEGVPRSARAMRRDAAPERHERDHLASLVCSWPEPSLAVFVASFLLGCRTATDDERQCPSIGVGNRASND
jgi:nucleoside-diphosphate-sugar epimerase